MKMNRREYLELMATSAAGLALSTKLPAQTPARKVQIPRIGMGSWITFNVGSNQKLRDARTEVLREFITSGGGLIDSSPMYGSSEAVLGYALAKLNYPGSAFYASKIWTSSASEGLEQFEESKRLWGLKTFDLIQIHNLDGWKEHMKNLVKKKQEGQIQHIGVTTSHGRRHGELEKIMQTQPIDFIQLTYNLNDREAENRILKLALDKKINVIVNRPLDGGELFNQVRGKTLPAWARDIDCTNWSQLFLKFVVSHPAITCAIPATSSVAHMKENMGALHGRLPDQAMRQMMIKHMENL